MRIIRNVGAATTPESLVLSERIDQGGSTAIVANVHVPFQAHSSARGEAQAIVVKHEDSIVKYVIMISPSSTIQEAELAQAVSSDSGTDSAGNLDAGKDLYATLLNLFAAARQEDFEDGVHTDFSRKLVQIIEMLGIPAIEVIASIIINDKTNPAVSAEALKWISHINQSRTYEFRRWLLERSLQSPFSRIRDAALIGIAAIDDPHSMAAIKDAIVRETCQELREDLKQVLYQLDPQCHLYSEK